MLQPLDLDDAPSSAPPGGAPSRFFLVLMLSTFAAVAYLFSSFVHDFVLAFVLTGLLSSLHTRLLPHVGFRRGAASLLTTALMVILLAIPVTLLIVSVSAEVHALYLEAGDDVSLEAAEKFLFGEGVFAKNARKLAGRLGVAYTRDTVTGYISQITGSAATFLYAQINVLLSNLLALLFHFGITTLIVFYMLQDGEALKRLAFRLSPLPEEVDTRLVSQFKTVSSAIIYGNGIGNAIQGVLGGLALSLAGVPSPVLWGTVMAIFASLPVIGISIVSVPAALYLALQGRYVAAFGLYAFCSILSLFVENVVKTKLIGSQVQLHSLLVFLSLLGGIAAFGLLGLLYGPLLVALAVTFLELYEARYQPGSPPGSADDRMPPG